jgi:putative flippase GtrA
VTGSLLRFVLVGGTTVLIDGGVYRLELLAGVPHDWAKLVSFLVGAVFAYVANWRFTFQGQRHRWSLVAFVVVYLCALGINVGVNALLLAVVGGGRSWQVLLAFLVATGASAAWNFVCMARFVFRAPARGARPAGVTTGA